MKYLVYCLCFAASVMVCLSIYPGKKSSSKNGSDDLAGTSFPKSRRSNMSVQFSELISADSQALDKDITFGEATNRIVRQERSPIRLRALMNYRVHFLSKEKLISALEQGEVRTNQDIAEAARRLTAEDPQLAFDIYMKRSFRPRTMENVYAYVHAMLWAWVQKEPGSLLARIKEMPRGGSQQDTSLTFSHYWANHDPATAVKHFGELVALRNMVVHGQGELSSARYSEIIMQSWLKKDRPAAVQYVQELPKGVRKTHFQKALIKFTPKK